MAASAGDLFKKSGASTVTTLSAPGKALGATSITVGSTTNYPTDTGITIAIRVVNTNGELVSGTYTEWRATVTSGTTLAIESTPVYGSDQVYAAGSTTQVFIPLSSDAHNELVDGLLVEHNQDGTLKPNAVVTANITDSSVTTAKIADASVTNAKLSTSAGESGGASLTYTPTFTNLTLGNGTLVARYTRIGKNIFGRVHVTFGTTTSVAGDVSMTLPVTAATYAGTGNITASGLVSCFDTSASSIAQGYFSLASTTSGVIRIWGASAAYTQVATLSATVPFTFATGDEISVTFQYEAA